MSKVLSDDDGNSIWNDPVLDSPQTPNNGGEVESDELDSLLEKLISSTNSRDKYLATFGFEYHKKEAKQAIQDLIQQHDKRLIEHINDYINYDPRELAKIYKEFK